MELINENNIILAISFSEGDTIKRIKKDSLYCNKGFIICVDMISTSSWGCAINDIPRAEAYTLEPLSRFVHARLLLTEKVIK